LAHLAANGSVTPGAQRTLDEMAARMDSDERAIAQSIGIDWIKGRSELTERALSGLKRADALVRAPQAN